MEMNEQFLSEIDRSARILEVGTNLGNQLLLLQKMGFENLYGIEIQTYAVEMAKYRTKDINILWGSALDIPFKDGFFDLVFTSGVLIHIHTNDVTQAMKEIYRCSNRYVWGLEYYADELTKFEDYRGQQDLLWKENFSKRYLDLFPDLTLLKEEYSHYPDSDNMDTMYLLSKTLS